MNAPLFFYIQQNNKRQNIIIKQNLSLFVLNILLNSQIENLESMTKKIFGIIIYL
jgi:hypothetical protein